MKIKRTMQITSLEQMCDLMCGSDEHEFCLRCGRRLKSPEARKIGYGTVCLKKLQHSTKNKLF